MLVKMGLTTPASRNLQPFRSINRALCICHPIMTIKKPAPGQLPTHQRAWSLKRHSSITWRRQAQVAPQPLPVPSSWSILTLAEPKAMCRGGGGTMDWEEKKLKKLGNAEKYGKRKVGVSMQAKEWMSTSCPGSFQIEDHGLQSVVFPSLVSLTHFLLHIVCSGEHASHLFLQN